ncbi:hypothetical protein BKA82DRAFT_228027 [Pisolithus tinctorius]|uniref:Heterokaryon incompatibility domain-containing protein n=1 Tax=Pisolithus tinctorius Marx 270 TaxID=870435 RepID=A0A0C3P942_PISTI|nr:hypothetical protein BKA82DRAFT_228027 [Pisolithus tinctorius]KIO10020.1 hypothetical protein M404DRAFT_228027 [Pisolithus tinctorius Marx 270]
MDLRNEISLKRADLKRFPPGKDGRFDALTDLADALYNRFKQEGEIEDLNEAITLLREALELPPIGNDADDRSLSLNNLAVCLSNRYENQGAIDDLEEAITLGRAALELCPPGHPDRCVSLHNLACDLRTRFVKQTAIHDLEEAIELLRAALELRPSGHPHRSSSLHQLALCFSNKYDNQGAVADLEEAVILGRAALELRPLRHPDRIVSLNNLAHLLRRRFQKQSSMDDLDKAIELLRAALELHPSGNLHRAFSFHEMALCLSNRYDTQGVVGDLEEAVTLGRAALELHLPEHPDHGVSLHNLACNLRRRFVKQAGICDLEVAIKLYRAALELRPSGHPRRSSSLHQLAICLSSRYDNQGVAADLEEAITLGRAALELRPLGHPDRLISLNSLAHLLRRRFQKQASMHDLDEAVELLRAALERPSGNLHRAFSFHELALCLSTKYDNQGVAADLDEAIMLGRVVLELRPPGHPDRGVSLNNLACNLRRRFQRQATKDDLEEAIELLRETLKLCPSGHSCWSYSLHQLALCLSNRYDNQGVVADLEEALSLRRAALEILPPGHPHRGVVLYNLACVLWRKFQKQADMPRLHRANSLCRGRSQSLADVPSSLFELSLHLWDRFHKQAALTDLDEAICLTTYALELRLPGHPDYAVSLKHLALFIGERVQRLAHQSKSGEPVLRSCVVDNLGALANYFRDRSRNQHAIVDLEAAITLYRYVLQFRPTGHPSRPSSLHDLAQSLADRFRQQPVAADLDEAIALEQEALQLLVPGDPDYDVALRCLTACIQLKISSQVATTPSDDSGVALFDIRQAVRDVAFETLKTMPTRLLHTHTGILCNRDAQVSHFMSSQQYSQLLSSCAACDPAQQMKLIRTNISRYFQYVMFSHRWSTGEPSLRDVEGHPIYGMSTDGGLGKLQAFCLVACERGYLWAWSDTCCIDRDSSAELQEAIGSMFACEWFRRGWTLQELLASRNILFYTQAWSLYKNVTSSNHKADVAVLEELERATGIESRFLTNFSPDIAYSLFGIFNLHLPVLYGESAENALGRLLSEIISQSGDISVLDWVGEASSFHSCFPAYITSYRMLPLPPPQPIAEEHAAMIHTEQPEQAGSSSTTLRMLYRSLANSPPPRFLSHRLILPCIAYRVTAIQRRRVNPSTRNYTYKILASGLRPLEVALPSKLEDATISQGALLLARPWHSRHLLGPFTNVHATTEEQLLFTLGRPFNALLLTKLPQNEYLRIASSNLITAHPIDSASILQSRLKIFDIV